MEEAEAVAAAVVVVLVEEVSAAAAVVVAAEVVAIVKIAVEMVTGHVPVVQTPTLLGEMHAIGMSDNFGIQVLVNRTWLKLLHFKSIWTLLILHMGLTCEYLLLLCLGKVWVKIDPKWINFLAGSLKKFRAKEPEICVMQTSLAQDVPMAWRLKCALLEAFAISNFSIMCEMGFYP